MLETTDVPWEAVLWSSMLGIVCVSVSVIICLCGCKASEPKDELVGIEGCVKKRNPEEFVQEVNANNITSSQVDSVSVCNEKDKKPISTANRSLPDLPIDKSNVVGDVSWEPNGDANSELYATVGIQNKKPKNVADTESRSPSTTYAQVKGEHPYDKLKKVEHPYAQVRHNRDSVVDPSAPSTSHQRTSNEIETNNAPRLTRGRITSRADSESEVSPVRELSIHAATAIAGHISANDDLPYMTPPTHFSGDSQDSGKGYTSISVREPLATIMAETKSNVDNRRKKNSVDCHYATVSDDSDEMYAAIDDPSHVYTSESETYAQIQPGRPLPQPDPPPDAVATTAGATPSTSTQQSCSNTNNRSRTLSTHSRQASSSSGSSCGIVSSPKPDKLVTKSPNLASPESDLYSSVQVSTRNVEDMYAKVNKKRRKEMMEQSSERTSTESGMSESSDSVSYKLQINQLTDISRSSTSHLSKTTDSSMSMSLSPCNRKDITDTSSSDDEESGCYERLGIARYDPGYESVNKGPPSDSDPNYEQLRPQEHEYASIARNRKRKEPARTDSDGYARVERNESDVTDGYARVERNVANDADGYARVQRNESDVADGYARLKLKNEGDKFAQGEDDGYATVDKNTNKTSERTNVQLTVESTYESLGHELESDDPGYECVNCLNKIPEPPYQLLTECESGTGSVNI